ncbi:hypothetical protein V1515DRAFT_645970 [Lipomyces mesembrius]
MEPVDLCHARLGHISAERIKQAENIVNGINVRNQSDKLVFVGPINPQGYDGSSCYLSVVDDATCGKWVYPIKSKGEAFDRLWKRVKRIRMNNGLEFGGRIEQHNQNDDYDVWINTTPMARSSQARGEAEQYATDSNIEWRIPGKNDGNVAIPK